MSTFHALLGSPGSLLMLGGIMMQLEGLRRVVKGHGERLTTAELEVSRLGGYRPKVPHQEAHHG